MTNTDRPVGRVHQGRNIKRFRDMLGIKQEALALELGDDWSQKKVSRLEENEKWVEAIEENKKLYERLLKEKDEKISLLEALMKK